MILQIFEHKSLNEARHTVNSETFARILFPRIALKDTFATLRIRD